MHAKRTLLGLLLDILLTIVLAVLVITFLVLLTTRHVPKRYLNTMLMPEESKQRLTETFVQNIWGVLTEKQHTNEPFEITIRDEEINAYLLGGLVSLREFIPPEIANPQVHFERDTIVLMGTVKPSNFHPMVVSIYCQPEVSSDGKMTFSILKVKGGAIRIPRSLVNDALGKLKELPIALQNVRMSVETGKITIAREGDEENA